MLPRIPHYRQRTPLRTSNFTCNTKNLEQAKGFLLLFAWKGNKPCNYAWSVLRWCTSCPQESHDLYKAHKNHFYLHLLIRWKTTTIIFSFKQTLHLIKFTRETTKSRLMSKRKREILNILQAVVWYSWEIKIDEVGTRKRHFSHVNKGNTCHSIA